MLALYGRRRVGKTELVKKFMENKTDCPKLYFYVDLAEEKVLLDALTKAVFEQLNERMVFTEFDDFFNYIIEKSKIYTSSFRSVISTIKNWRDNKHILLFLLAFYFLTEGIVTLTYFISLYAATTLKITTTQIAIVFIITQFVSIPSTIILGRYSDKIGYRKVIISSLFIFTIATILLSFAKTLTMVYLVAILIGLVLGVAQSNSRAWFTKIIPEEKRSELFGFNALASKISATIGPPLFGLISVATGNQRLAMISIIIYFVIALILFYKAKE